jgi:hypothetical protein
MIEEWGIGPTPMTAFYDNNPELVKIQEFKGCDLIRFAICKSNKTLSDIEDRINKREMGF